MTKVIKVTEDGISLFKAISIGIGFEILKNNIKSDSAGSPLLLDEFAKHHPKFLPKTWDTLREWLSLYNNSKDMELILAPVLFKLNQRFKQDLETQILDELTNLIWKNKAKIDKDEQWYQLSIVEGSVALFPQIDNLPMAIRKKLLQQLKEVFTGYAGGLSRNEFRLFLATHAKELLASLKTDISVDPDASNRAFNVAELKDMANALSINLIEHGARSSAPGTNIHISRKPEGYWEVSCEDEVEGILNINPPLLAASVDAPSILPPTPEQLDMLKQPRVLISQEFIDNPGRGNCAFYAFAIGLIEIIKEEQMYGNKTKYNYWVTKYPSLADQYDAICAFDYKQPNNILLDKLQRSLRNVAYNFQVRELRQACIMATAPDDLENEDLTLSQYQDAMIRLHTDKPTDPYKNALKRKYQTITGNSTYIHFAAMYYGNREDTREGLNPFAGSGAVKKALKDLDRSKIEANFEDLVLVPLFLKLLYGAEQALKPITQETELYPASPILSGMGNITQEFYWGTALDMDYLATIFAVNLHTLENGVAPRLEGRGDIPDRHTITLNNNSNIHWTTQVNRAREIKCTVPAAVKPEDKSTTTTLNPSAETPKKEAETPKTETVGKKGILRTTVRVDSSPLTLPSVSTHLRKVRFNLTESQTLKELKNEENEDKKSLDCLRLAVSNATTAYTKYSNSIWFSLFHRHGNTGRVRAKAFNTRFLEIQNYDEAKKEILSYLLNNKDNGNTHPHSYRTMLLHQMLDTPKPTLQYTSDHFLRIVGELASAFKVSASAVANPSI